MKPAPRLAFLFLLVLCLALLVPSRAVAANRPVAVAVLPGAPEIDPAALRDAVAGELDAPVLDGVDAPGAAFAVVVSIDRPRSELVVERRDGIGGMSRRVPLPADARATLRAAVFLIGNLARDEASELVDKLHPRKTEDEAPPSEPSPPPAKASQLEATKPEATPLPRLWVGVDLSYDLVVMRSRSQFCSAGGGDACTDASGNDLSFGAGAQSSVAGGLASGNVRALVSFDYAATANLLVGARVGYVYGTYPGHAASAFPPVHLEARATYLVGEAPLVRAGFAPYVMVAAGVSQWSAETAVRVTPAATSAPGPSANYEGWEIGGPGFASLGAGVRWAMAPRLALLLGPRVNVAFGASSPLLSFAPELGFQYGF